MLMARKAMQAGDDSTIEVLVDCAASVENIGRMAEQLHWSMTPREVGAETVLELQRRQPGK